MKILKRIHDGYFSEVDVCQNDNGQLIVRKRIKPIPEIDHLKKITQTPQLSRAYILTVEEETYNRLSRVESENIIIPQILSINVKKHEICIEYIQDMIGFYHFIVQTPRDILGRVFKDFGEFLARFHAQNSVEEGAYLHGDLSQKNIKFNHDGKLVLLDAGFNSYLKYGSVYKDVARFILNLFPYNPLYNIMLLGKRDIVMTSFLKGYKKSYNGEFDSSELVAIAYELIDFLGTHYINPSDTGRNMTMYGMRLVQKAQLRGSIDVIKSV